MTLRTALCELLGIEHPIVQSGMGGVAGPDLVAEVSRAGGLGIIAALNLTADQVRDAIRRVRDATDRPFGVNQFMPDSLRPPADPGSIPEHTVAQVQSALNGFRTRLGLPTMTARPPAVPDLIDAAFEVIIEERVPVWSVGLGQPSPEQIRRAHERGIKVMAMVTTVEDARAVERAGVDVIVAQGGEAGGHRGTFMGDPEHAMTGTLALVRLIVRAVQVPVVAAGGIMDGAGIAAALTLGAQAAQLGTAFVVCAESGAPEAHKKAIAGMDGDETSITRAFSGKPARTVRNAFSETAEREGWPLLPFPVQNKLTAPLRQASARDGASDDYSAWSGQGGALARPLPAAELVRLLVEEAIEAVERLQQTLARPNPSLG